MFTTCRGVSAAPGRLTSSARLSLWARGDRASWGTARPRALVDHQDARSAQKRIESCDLHPRGGLAVRGLSRMGDDGGPSRSSMDRAVEHVEWPWARHGWGTTGEKPCTTRHAERWPFRPRLSGQDTAL